MTTQQIEQAILQLQPEAAETKVLKGKSITQIWKALGGEFMTAVSYGKFKVAFRDQLGYTVDGMSSDGAYKTFNISSIKQQSQTQQKKEPFVKKNFSLKGIEINEKDFEPFKTGRGIDIIASIKGGFMPGTTFVFVGGPGAGKSTAAEQIISDVTRLYPETENTYLSSEMKEMDILEEFQKKPWMENIDYTLFSQHDKSEYLELLNEVFGYGYDLIVFDSFANTVERLQSEFGMSAKEASNYLMRLIEEAADGKTKTGKKTIVIVIQQETKGGTFVGGNNLKHDTSGMCHFKINPENNERACYFSKNRKNGAYIFKELVYFLNDKNEMDYDVERFMQDRDAEKTVEKNKQEASKQKEQFDKIFMRKNKEQDEKESDEENDSEIIDIEETDLPMFALDNVGEYDELDVV